MTLYLRPVVAALAVVFISGACFAESSGQVVRLLEGKDLSNFYTFLTDFGVDRDPDKVFALEDGVLRISGQHYGYLATKAEYSNYRLLVEFKWGDQTWPPREKNARDSGVLVHCVGPDKVWMKSIECQIIEGGTGDILVVEGAGLTVGDERLEGKTARFDRPGRNPWKDEIGFRGPNEIENPHGEWNSIEVLCEGGKVRVTVNGHLTLEGDNATPTAGKIVLQSEGAEIFFRRLDLYPLP